MRHGTRPALMALVLTLVAVAPTGAQSVEKSSISFMLDWTIAGTHAPYFIPLDKGYYKAEGLNVKIDRGTGAGNTASNVASGVYDFGWADVTTLIAFDAQNPTKELTLVYISLPRDQISVLRYADIGFDVYGTGLWVRRDFLEKNPRTVAAMVRAVNKGTKDAIANPGAAAEMMTKYAPLLKTDIECQRLLIALDHHLNPDVARYGLSHVDPKRMQKTIEQVVHVQKFERTPALDHVWTDRFLPPQAERMAPPLGTCGPK